MASRSKARRRALEVLFEADLRGLSPLRVLADRVARTEAMTAQDSDPHIGEFTISLVEGVWSQIDRIDPLIETYSVDWTIDRMPAVDRNLVRLGIYEILFADDVPDVVAIDEAVSLAQELSTAESPQFVNGLLNRIMELKPTLQR
jgi:transcription antitermination protein NusB